MRVISEPSKTEVARDDDQNNGLGVRLCNSIPAKLPLLDPIFQNEKYQINDYGPTVDISGMKVNPFGEKWERIEAKSEGSGRSDS